jgi:hypothetical protein
MPLRRREANAKQLNVRMPPDELTSLDAWIKTQPAPRPTRAEAITRKAAIIGNQGVADVEVHVGQQAVTFMEELNGGVVQTTTVANDGKSVHSRHTIIGREMKPSQYYGECVRR